MSFGDPDVERAVKAAVLAEPDDTTGVPEAAMTELKTLYLDSNLVSSLAGLQYATNLETLILTPGRAVDSPQSLSALGASALSPLTNLNKLVTVALSDTQVDLSALSALVGHATLTTLDLSWNEYTSLSAMPTNLNGVRNLDLSYNQLNLAMAADLPANVFDTVSSLKLYGNYDPSVTTDQTFDPTPLRGLLIDYDLPTVGLEKVNNLPALAKALHYSPVEIYEYIYNNIEYQAYDGVMKDAFSTFNTQAGNAWDQSGLLLELLKYTYQGTAFGVSGLSPSIYKVRATAPEADVARLVGVDGGAAAEFLLDSPVISPTSALNAVRSGGNIEFDHAYAQVNLPAPGGTTTYRLDPSWKLKELFSPLSTPVLASLPFNRDEYLSVVRTDLPHEWYEKKALAYLAENHPGMSLADVGYDGEVTPRSFASLPTFAVGTMDGYTYSGGTPFTYTFDAANGVNVTFGNYHRIGFKLRNVTTSAVSSTIYRAASFLGQNPLMVRFSNASGGGTAAVYAETPTGPVAIVSLAGFAATDEIEVTASYRPNDTSADIITRSTKAKANQVIAIGLEANQITDALLIDQQNDLNGKMIAAVKQYWDGADAFESIPLSTTDVGNVLSLALWTYFRRMDQAQEVADRLGHTVQMRNHVAFGFASGDIITSSTFATHPLYDKLQLPVQPLNMFIDLPGGFVDAARVSSASPPNISQDERNELVRFTVSAQEHAVWEEVTNTTGMSTIKSLQLAEQDANNRIVQFPSAEFADFDAMINLLDNTHPTTFIASLEAAELQGYTTFLVPEKPTPLQGWNGAGYYAEKTDARMFKIVRSDGFSGEGGFRIPNATDLTPDSPPSKAFQSLNGDPVNIANGAVVDNVVDIDIPRVGEVSLRFERYYDSTNDMTDVEANSHGHLGRGWYHSFSDHLRTVAGTNDRIWVDGKGQRHTFISLGGGQYQTPDELRGEFKANASGDGFYFQDKNGIRRVFDGWGRLQSIRDRNFNMVSVYYVTNTATDFRIYRLEHNRSGGKYLQFGYDYTGGFTRIATIDYMIPPNVNAYMRWYYDHHADGSLSAARSYADANTPESKIEYTYILDPQFGDTPIYGKLNQIRVLQDANAPGGARWSTVTHMYYANGRAFQMTDGEQYGQNFTYDLYRNRTRFLDEHYETTATSYDSDGRTLEVSHPDGGKELFTWITSGAMDGLVSEWTRADNISESYTYGVAGSWDERLGNLTYLNEGRRYGATFTSIAARSFTYCTETTITNGVGCSSSPGAGGELHTTYVTGESRPSGITTSYVRDDLGNILTKTEAANQPAADQRITTYEYWTGGLLKFMTDARGVATTGDATDYRTTYYYSSLGEGLLSRRDTWISAAQTAIELWTYDNIGFGHLTGYTDAENRSTTYLNDLLGRRIRTTLPATQDVGATTATQAYFNDGNVKSTTDHNGRATTYQYDGRRQLVRTKYADGALVSVSYDALRNVEYQADELGNVTALVYDERGRASGVLRADGSADLTYYDADGHVVLYIDALGRRTRSEYDARGWLVRTTEPTVTAGAPVTQYGYDLDGNLTTKTDALLRQTAYEYTPLNQLKKRTDPDPEIGLPNDSPIWQFAYDKAGNLNAEIDPYYNQTLYNNDGLNRRTAEVFYEVSTACGGSFCQLYDAQTTYDKVGNVLTREDRLDRVTSYVYDARNQLREMRQPEPTPLDANDDRPWTQYRRDAMGNAVIVVDPRGMQTNTAFDPRNRPKSTTSFSGLQGLPGVVEVTSSRTLRDAAGREIGVDDGRKFTSWRKLDALGRTVETIDAGMERSRVEYDLAGNARKQFDALGHVTHLEYDNLNRLIRRTDPDPDPNSDANPAVLNENDDPPVWNFVYDLVGNLLSTVDPMGYATSNTYDRLNRLGTEAFPDPNPYDLDSATIFRTHTYDKMGRVTAEQDFLGQVTFMEYNSLGFMTEKTQPDPDGAGYFIAPVWQYLYDDQGNLLREIDPEGRKLEYEYDGLDRLMRKLYYRQNGSYAFDADYRYDANGNLVWIQDEAVRDTFYEYDSLNRRTKVTRPPTSGQTHVSQTSYDAAGNVRTTTDETGMVTTYHHDALGRVTYEALPGGNRITRFTYFAVGTLETVTDALNQTTTYGYDGLNRRISELDAASATATTAYDLLGNVVKVVDRNNNTTTFEYTKLNQLRTDAKSGMGTRTYEYNRAGAVSKYVDREGRRTEYTYDNLNRAVQERWLTAGGTPLNTIDTQYNNAGQVENIKDTYSAIDYEYGDFGWRTSESNFNNDCFVNGTCPPQVNTPGLAPATVYSTYDNYGNRAIVNDDFDGAGQLTYVRDEAQRLTGVNRSVNSGSFNYTYTVTLGYDQADRLTGTTRTYNNVNAAEWPWQPSTTNTYDGTTKRLSSIAFTQPAGGFTESLTYDAADRLDTMTDHQGLHDYAFNSTNQLTAANHPGAITDESFAIDANGNLGPVTAHNKLASAGGSTYGYDNEGNLTSVVAGGKYYQFVYDHRNRLTRVNRRNGVTIGAPIEHRVDYTYDALDRRIIRSIDADGSGPGAAVAEKYVYDGDNLYLEFTASGTTPTHRYLYADAVDAILADDIRAGFAERLDRRELAGAYVDAKHQRRPGSTGSHARGAGLDVSVFRKYADHGQRV